MSNLATSPVEDIRYEVVTEPSHEVPEHDPLTIARRRLRGRYQLALLLAASLGTVAALLGYSATKPMYESTGLVRVAGALPTILYPTQENQIPPMFDAFVSAQATFLKSRQVLNSAVNSPYLADTRWPRGNAGIALLDARMRVERKKGEQVIVVSVQHADPTLAQAAVNAVLWAFDTGYRDPDHIPLPQKQAKLQQRTAELQCELEELRDRLMTESNNLGVDAIERMHTSKVQQVSALEQKLAELAVARHAAETGEGPMIAGMAGTSAVSMRDINADLRTEEQKLISELLVWEAKHGPKHPMVRDLTLRIDAVRAHRALREQTQTSDVSITARSTPTASLAQIDALCSQYRSILMGVEQQAADLGRQLAALAATNEAITEVRARLRDTQRRIDEIHVEAGRDNYERVAIAAAADYPIVPVSDRRKGLAAAGGLFGATCGLALVLLIGAFDPRCRYAAEIVEVAGGVPIVGMLPELKNIARAPNETAALCVHQLRNYLELQHGAEETATYTITGVARDEGRTSLVLALGASFAAAGHRTLLVDTDVERFGLTRHLGLQAERGLCEAIGPDQGSGEVHETERDRLFVLPIGQASQIEAEDLSRDKLDSLLKTLRREFDVVIIDAGPVLSSVESSLVSAAADRVLLVVSRNEHKRLVQSSLEYLHQLGVQDIGLVLNRALPVDLNRQRKRFDPTRHRAISFVSDQQLRRRRVGTVGRIGVEAAVHTERKRRAA